MSKRSGSDKQKISTKLLRAEGKGRRRRLMKPAVLSRRAGSLIMCHASR